MNPPSKNFPNIVPSNMTFDRYDDPLYYKIIQFNFAVATASTFIAFFFILFRSPSAIGRYKWFLLNISAASFAFDLWLTFIYVPQPLFPALVMCTKGLLEPFGNYFGGVLGFMSVTWAFVYRFLILINKEHLIYSISGVICMAFSQIFYETPTIVLYSLAAHLPYDFDYTLEAVYAKFPHVRQYMEGHSCAASSFDASPFTKFFLFVGMCQFATTTFINLWLLHAASRCLKNVRTTMSERTAKMHRQLLKSLIFQMTIPFCTLFIPFVSLAFFALVEVENIEFLFKLVFEIGTSHSFLNTLVMVYCIQPYKDAVKTLLCRKSAITPNPSANLSTSRDYQKS
ncbi:serpentine type 7TM GPCR chemoreceptor srh domain-containing protein [Ditylenchus destructor]|uniref:Serpentine type 7TM GPCR chemoreceptor srh domain-containing protein n=1 Tax=Ditylenchus destructor TaxID=166010 RepID=A0AAD4R4Y2_9BILA|nr:serpentine type 7TM GPCR chemoreceptor srh domain-containing protein [Ditylenchus destructor]